MTKKLLGGVLIGLLSACGGAAAEGAGAEVPSQYQGEIRSTDTARGEQLFNDVCGACHMGGQAPDLSAEAHAAGEIRMIVRQGEETMPPIDASQLSDDDLEAVLAYMQTINAVH